MPDPTPILPVVTTLLVTSFTCNGLLALWAATSSRHWLLRCSVVLAVLSPLLLIPAYEPWIVFALQACVVVAGVQAWQWWTVPRQAENNRRFRFSLGTLLAIAPLVAALTAIATRIVTNLPEQNAEAWTTIALNGVCSGCAVLLGAWMRTSKRKWIAWPVALLMCLGLAGVTAWFDWFLWSVRVYGFWPPDPRAFAASFGIARDPEPRWVWFAIMPAMLAGTWLMVCVWFAAVAIPAVAGEISGPVPLRRGARQSIVRCVFGVLLVALAVPPTFVVWKLLHPLPIPDIVVPQPNGRDDIEAAGEVFRNSPILSGSVEPGSTAELAVEIAKHAGAYQRLRLGLGRDVQSKIWPQDGDLLGAYDSSMSHFGAEYSAAQALVREAELAQQQKRYGDAARIGLENIRLGQAITRGGGLIAYLHGIAMEGKGDRSFYQALPKLDGNQCREMIAALGEVERQRERLDDVLYRGRVCAQRCGGWHGHLRLLLDQQVAPEDLRRMLATTARNRREAATRLLIVETALRAHQLERGAPPERLEQLIPEFLSELPVDPFDVGGRPFRYRRSDDRYVLYSVGTDGKDNRGRPPARNRFGGYELKGGGDLRLDVFFPPNQP